jgi:hypothetical protein
VNRREAEGLAYADETRRLRQALEAIIVRCEEGDQRTNWLPTIADIARRALEGRP